MFTWFDTILWPLKVAVAWIMVQFHNLLTWLGLDSDSGLSWALSIVGLVIIMRIILIPLFVKQIRAARGMQMLSPELQALQKKYKGKQDPASREAMSREMMALYRKHGTNPFASCLPTLAQSPVFFALFRVLYNIPNVADGTYERGTIGPLTSGLADEFTNALIFGARLSDWFLMPDAPAETRIVTVVLIVLMSLTTFTTQRQLTRKNMPAAALQGPMAQQQKMLLYLLPLIFAITGVNFPIGVLIYWTTTNVWSMGQQFYVIRRNPTPGSEAERLLKERRARKAAKKGIVLEEEEKPTEPEKPRGQRQQPVRKDRARQRPPGQRPSGQRQPNQRPKSEGQSDSASSKSGQGQGQRKPRQSDGSSGQGQRKPRLSDGSSGQGQRKKRRRPTDDGRNSTGTGSGGTTPSADTDQ